MSDVKNIGCTIKIMKATYLLARIITGICATLDNTLFYNDEIRLVRHELQTRPPEKAKNGGRNVSSWWGIDHKTISSKDKAKAKQEMS